MGGKSGGGSSTTYAYDPVSSAKMVEIAQAQQAMAEDAYADYKKYYQQYEIDSVNAQSELLPYITENSRLMLEQQQNEIELSQPITEEFYKQALEGVDPSKRMMQAQADVAQGFDEANSTMTRNMSRMGVSPESGNFAGNARKMAVERAKAIGGARTGARNQAEQESFSRLASGMSVRGSATGLSGAGTGIQVADQYGRAAGSYSNAASTTAPLATRQMSATTTSTQPNDFLQGLMSGGFQLGSAYLSSRRWGG